MTGGDPKTGKGSWADEMGAILKEAVKVDPDNLEKELGLVSQGLNGVVAEVEAFERAGVTSITLEDGDEIDDEYGDTMTAFVAQAEQDVLSEAEATAKGKDSGKLWGQINGTKDGLNKLVSFFGARLPAQASPLPIASVPSRYLSDTSHCILFVCPL